MVKIWTNLLKAAVALLALAGIPFLVWGVPESLAEMARAFPEFAYLWPVCVAFMVGMAVPLYVAAGGAWWFLSLCGKTGGFGTPQNRPLALVAACAAAELMLGLALFGTLWINGAVNGALFLAAVPVGIAGLAVIAATRLYREMAKSGKSD